MSNNCCGEDFHDGGTWNNIQLNDPSIINGIMTNASLTGGVTLDEATAEDVARQICGALKDCVEGYVNNGSFKNVTLNEAILIAATLTNASFTGTIALSEESKLSLASELCEHLMTCVLGHVQNNDLSKLTAQNADLSTVTLRDKVTLDEEVRKQIAEQLCSHLKQCVIDHVSGNKLTALDAQNVKLDTVTLSGVISATVDAAKNIADIVGPHISSYVVSAIESARLSSITASNVTLTDVSLRGTLDLGQDAVKAIYTSIETSVASTASGLIIEALGKLKPSDIGAVDAKAPLIVDGIITGGKANNLAISGGTLSGMTGTNLTFDTGRLKDFTLAGQVPLDSEARDHLCAQLKDCITSILVDSFSQQDMAAVFSDCDGVPRSAGTRIASCSDMTNAIALMEQKIINQMPISDVITGLSYDDKTHKIILETTLNGGQPQRWEIALDELGGQVLVDNNTIVGDGTTKSPLRVNLKENEVPPAATPAATWLPTDMIGGRNKILGEPDAWIALGGWLFPVYKKQAEG